MNLTEFFINITQLGAEWVLWLLVGLSLVSLTVMIERGLYFVTHRLNFVTFSEQLESLLRAGKLADAKKLAAASRAPECLVVLAGLDQYKKSSDAVSEAMLAAKARQRVKMEAYLTILATLGNNVPFVGLLGTVLGIIKASSDLATAKAGEDASSNAVMAGVFEALVATAVGLFVAIPAVVAYNYFQRCVRIRMGQVDSLAHTVLCLHAQTQPSEKIGAGLASSAGPLESVASRPPVYES